MAFSYEAFELEDLVIDEKRMVAVDQLKVALYDSKTGKVLLRKHCLPRYQLVLGENNRLKISTIHFFGEAVPPEVDEAYGISPPHKE